MRNSIKMWQNDYSVIYETFKEAYNVSDDYFGNVCKPIAKKLKLYDIFGVDRANGIICGTTVRLRMKDGKTTVFQQLLI